MRGQYDLGRISKYVHEVVVDIVRSGPYMALVLEKKLLIDSFFYIFSNL